MSRRSHLDSNVDRPSFLRVGKAMRTQGFRAPEIRRKIKYLASLRKSFVESRQGFRKCWPCGARVSDLALAAVPFSVRRNDYIRRVALFDRRTRSDVPSEFFGRRVSVSLFVLIFRTLWNFLPPPCPPYPRRYRSYNLFVIFDDL